LIEWPYDDATAFARHGNPLFGDGWERTFRGEDPDAFFVDTPVGEPCSFCDQPVEADDSGELMMQVPGTDGASNGSRKLRIVAQHIECGLLLVFGHELGVCSCTRWLDLEPREAALEAMRRFRARH
jgi:hypothetical protein